MHRRTFAMLAVACLGLLQFHPGVLADSFDDFFLAIQFDDENRLRALLLKGMDPNTVNDEGFPAIMFAMMQGSPKCVRVLLLSPKMDANQPDMRGDNPLMTAAGLNRPEWVAALLSKGARQTGKGHWSALHYAAASGASQVIELLLNAGGNVNVGSPNGTTPLMMAAREGQAEAVHVLLERGADPSIVNQSGYNAAGYAMKAQREELALEIMKKEKALRAPSKPKKTS